jgi:predicted MFS family arabinose efflux permease
VAEPSSDAPTPAGLSRGLVLLLATACGAAVANMYYAQPLLHTLGRDFGVGDGTAGLLVTVGQVGYGLGLAFLVPLGDLRERRDLISTMLVITACALGVAAAAPTFLVFAIALGLAGVTCVVAMVIVPMASSLSAPSERGRVVGTVMSGLLIGILLARTVSGLVASAFGWRTVFVIGAVLMLIMAGTLRRRLPRVPPTTELGYGGVLRSVFSLIRREPILRQRMMLGALAFGCFSTLWTSLAFLLAGAPYHYGNAVIGLFGLAGVAGAAAASIVGRLADRGRGTHATTATILSLLVSWGILAAGRSAVIPLIIGIAVLDLGVQGLHISNQSAIYSLHADARSRLTTAYMVSYFLGGALLSAVTSSIYGSTGWTGVCILGAGTAVLALAVWSATSLLARRRNDQQEAWVGERA